MNRIKKYTLCLCVAVVTVLLMSVAVYADSFHFIIDGPEGCAVGDTVELTVILSADEELEDSDAFLVYDTEYFDYVDSDSDDFDPDNGTVRLRGSFGQDGYSCSWTVELQAKKEGSADFDITDRWVKSAAGQVVTSTADGFNLEISESGSSQYAENNEGTEYSDEELAEAVYVDTSFSFHFIEPKKVPDCFDETVTQISGVSCKVWKFNSKMSQKVDYSADIDEFYAVYGYIEDEEDACWYVYDTVGESFQRLIMLEDAEVEKATEPVADAEVQEDEETSSFITDDITKLIIIVFIILIVLLIVVNVIFNKLEKNSRKKRIAERQRLSREELRQKREIENKIQEKKQQEAQSQNMR